MKKVILCGALGKMGSTVAEEIAGDPGLELIAAVEAPGHDGLGRTIAGAKVIPDLASMLPQCDVVVDFTTPLASLSNILASAEAGKPAVVGTTGFTAEQFSVAQRAGDKIPLIISPNMSIGVNLMFKIVRDVTQALPDFDAEIVEIHHDKKKDSPSGTARRIAAVIESVRPSSERIHGREGITGPRKRHEIGLHSLRGGDVVGEHTVIFAGEGERFEITHRAHSRKTFARGTLRAIHFIIGRKPGLYTMSNVLGL